MEYADFTIIQLWTPLLYSYFDFVHRVQAVLLEWKRKFMQQQINYDEILTYTSQQSQLKCLAQTVCASSAIVDSQDVKNGFQTAFEQLNFLLIKYIPGQPDAKWCTLPSLLQGWGVAFPTHLLDVISQHVLFPGEEKAGELLNNQPSPNSSGIYQPGRDISLKLTKSLTLLKLYTLVQGLEEFLQPVMSIMNMLVFFKLHSSEMFDKYLQFYLRKESDLEAKEQHSATTLTGFSHTASVFRATSLQSQSGDKSAVKSYPLRVLVRAGNHTHDLIMKLVQGTATASEIVAKGELNLENLNIEKELSTLLSFLAYLKLPLNSCEELTGVQKVLELFQSIYHIPLIHSIREQYLLQASLDDPQLFELCKRQVEAILLEWKLKFVEQKINYDEILTYMSQQPQLECLGQIMCASSAIVECQVTQAVKNTLLATFEQLNAHLIRYVPGHPDAKWCTLPSLLQDWDVALPSHLLELISQHVVLPGEKKAGELLDNQPSPNTTGVFQPGHDISLKLTKALSLHEVSLLVEGLETFLQPIMGVLDTLVFFKLHPSEMFDKYLQVYLKRESKTVVRGQQNASNLSPLLSTVSSFPATSMQPKTVEQNEAKGFPLDMLQRAVTRTHEMIMKLIQGTVAYSEIISKEKLDLENLNIEQEFNTLRSFSAYLKFSQATCAGLAGVQSMLELFKYVHHIRTIDSVWEQYQQHGCLKDKQLVELCQHRVQAVLLEWNHKFMAEHTNYDKILNYTRQQTQLENLGQTICACFASEDTQDTLTVNNMFQNAFDQLNNHLIKYIPGQPDAKWCTLPSLLQGWGVALPTHLLDVISQHVLFPWEKKSGELFDNQPSLPGKEKAQDKPFSSKIFQPAHEISLKLTMALSLHELSELVKGLKTFLQSTLELIQELFQCIHYIQTVYDVCEQYRLQGCLDDFQLVELYQLVKDLNQNHGKVAPLEASKMIERIKKNPCLGSEEYLELFTTVCDSNAFYQFVHEKQFVGEKGQAVFLQQYQLITAQLQHEEYNETVLNHLYAAFKIIELFMDTHQSFQQLMSHVTSLDVTNGVKQLQTVNSNITLIQLWFSRAEVGIPPPFIQRLVNVCLFSPLSPLLPLLSARETHWRMWPKNWTAFSQLDTTYSIPPAMWHNSH